MRLITDNERQDYNIVAPVAGTIYQLSVKEGDIVKTGEELGVIDQEDDGEDDDNETSV